MSDFVIGQVVFSTPCTWQPSERRSIGRWSILMGSLLLVSGCHPTTKPQVVEKPGSVKSFATKRAEISADSGIPFEPAVAESPEQADLASIPVDTANSTPGSGPASNPSEPVDDSPVDDSSNNSPAPDSSSPALGPTPEQIARWTGPAVDPLQLLAIREGSKTGLVTSMAHTPDGLFFVLAGTQVTLWSIAGEKPEHLFAEFDPSHEDRIVRSIAVSPDGQRLAAGDSQGRLRIWNLTDRSERTAKELYSNDITQVAYSPDGQEIATISFDNVVSIWNADTLLPKTEIKLDTNGVKQIAYMAPTSLAAAGETTTRWNTSTGKLEATLSSGRYNFSLKLSPDSSQFLFGDKDGMRLWNVAAEKIAATLHGNFASDELTEFSPDGQYLATANGSSFRIWELTRQGLLQMEDAFGAAIIGMSWLPNSNLLLVATENGRVRIWGTPKLGEVHGLRPIHVAIALPESSSQIPATPEQMRHAIDLRSFPRLPGDDMMISDTSNLGYTANVDLEEAIAFYRYFLAKLDWVESKSDQPSPGSIEFRKRGFLMQASFGEGGESRTVINLHNQGNFDLRWAPRFDSAPVEETYASPGTVIYRTKADLTQIEISLLRKMHAAGWTPYARLHSSHSETLDGRDLTFLQNSAELRASVGRFPAEPESYHIQYAIFPMQNALPVPPDSGFVEFDGSTEPNLVATTAMNLSQATEFYDRELKGYGWLARDFRRTIKDDHCWLYYVQGQKDLTVGLQKLKNGRTRIRVGENLESSSWQLAKEEPDPAVEASEIGLEAADFPILNSPNDAKLDAIDKTIEFQMNGTPLAKVADMYTKRLADLGWEVDSHGVRADDYLLIQFNKESKEISLRGRLVDGNAIVNVQGDGLIWTKPLPGGEPVISYEAWLRRNKHPAVLDLLDRYESEMRALSSAKSGS